MKNEEVQVALGHAEGQLLEMMGIPEDMYMPPQFVMDFMLTQMDFETMTSVAMMASSGDYEGAVTIMAESVDPEEALDFAFEHQDDLIAIAVDNQDAIMDAASDAVVDNQDAVMDAATSIVA